jgi:hypothetical protein
MPDAKPEPERNVCDRCSMPVTQTPRGWEHAEMADAAFCGLLFPREAPRG